MQHDVCITPLPCAAAASDRTLPCLCVKCCPVNARVTSLMSVAVNASGPRRGSRAPTPPCTSVLPPMLPWTPIIPGCGACYPPLRTCLLLVCQLLKLIVACAIICAHRLPLPWRLPCSRTLLRITFLTGGVVVPLAPATRINHRRRSLDMCSSPLPLMHSSVAVLFPFLCILYGKLPYCHSVDWDSVPVHG
jgi:hypothetical protein